MVDMLPTSASRTQAGASTVAYLVMEHIVDGCTLRQSVLEEGKRLPARVGEWISWSRFAQRCGRRFHLRESCPSRSEAENIWLEPTGSGGYRVKVPDFGIAKTRRG